ncbi:hypothetical protein ACFU9X_17305 [Streptomyces atratus]|uniref:hypothetical protein n=1 Tax=Streptomyces atratus TaxID=1893 RepID=UPI0036946530
MFQLAEEGAPLDEVGGAQAMLDAGAFQAIEPTMLFGMHLSPLRRGWQSPSQDPRLTRRCHGLRVIRCSRPLDSSPRLPQ